MTNLGNNRIIVLIDMDCFFCQVEAKLQPEYQGKPLAVVQYSQWELGGIIAVNYEAREYGVTRHMRADEAKEKCPNLVLASVPCLRGKSDTSRYRIAGREVIDVIKQHCNIVERASVDEAYLDLTEMVNKRFLSKSISPKELITSLPNTYIVGHTENGKNDEEERQKGLETWMVNIFEELYDDQALKLAIAGTIVEELRADIYKKTRYQCSAGIAHNKILAKLACGLHKPNQQTILPIAAVSDLYSKLPIKKVRNLGGKFGNVVVDSLGCNVVGDLLQYSLHYLQKRFDEKTGLWLYNIARGMDQEPVVSRLLSKSIGACKKFPGKQAIDKLDMLEHWIGELAAEVCERLEVDFKENERRATLLTFCYHYYQNRNIVSQTRSFALNSYKPEKITMRCVKIITNSARWPIAYLGMSASKFVQYKNNGALMNFLKNIPESKLDLGSIDIVKQEITFNIKENSNNKQNAKDKETLNVSEIKTIEERSSPTTDESPMTQRVNKLIVVCNNSEKENQVIKTELTSKSDNLYPHRDKLLDSNRFKESFFMNVLKCKENIQKLNVTENKDEECNKLKTEIENRNKDAIKQCDNFTNIKEESTASTSHQATSIQLREIFPDLNNIDLNVLSLLPQNLQDEAKKYLKIRNKCNSGVIERVPNNTKSNTKIKSTPSIDKKNSPIYGFLKKISSNEMNDNKSLQRCDHCDRMIENMKYNEHLDFHIAQDLHRTINEPLLNDIGVKRKSNSTMNSTAHGTKRRLHGDRKAKKNL